MTDKKTVEEFVRHWTGKGYEKGESQIFWIDLLQNVYGVENISAFITFEEQVKKIELTAQGILDARAKYPECSLADLYDELTMPPELRKAHQKNDLAVMNAYGFDKKITEWECVAELMKIYQKLTEK